MKTEDKQKFFVFCVFHIQEDIIYSKDTINYSKKKHDPSNIMITRDFNFNFLSNITYPNVSLMFQIYPHVYKREWSC